MSLKVFACPPDAALPKVPSSKAENLSELLAKFEAALKGYECIGETACVGLPRAVGGRVAQLHCSGRNALRSLHLSLAAMTPLQLLAAGRYERARAHVRGGAGAAGRRGARQGQRHGASSAAHAFDCDSGGGSSTSSSRGGRILQRDAGTSSAAAR
jgi:hypothetical protein